MKGIRLTGEGLHWSVWRKSFVRQALKGVMLGVVSVAISGCAADMALRGIDAYAARNYPRAVEEFQSCVAEEGDTGELASHCSFMLGKSYFDQQRYPEAIAALEKAIAVYRKGMGEYRLLPAWHFWLGRAYFETRRYQESALSFQKAASMAPENPRSGVQASAIWWHQHYAPLIPPKAGCYFWLGTAYYRNAQYPEAIGALKRAVELDPTATDPYTTLAAAHRELKQYGDGIAAAKRSIEIKPSGFAYGVLASIHARQRQSDAAMAAYQKAIELDPKNVSHYFMISNLLTEREDYAGAIAVNRKAQALAPENANIPYAIASLYMDMGKYDEAIAALNKAISLQTITGLGVEVAAGEQGPVVKNVMAGPAKRAGIQAGDRIVRIDGQSAEGWDLQKTLQHLTGQEGSRVALAVERKGFDKPIETTAVREKIVLKDAATYLANRSLAHRAKGNRDAFHEDAQKAYALNPDDPWSKSAIAIDDIDQGKYPDALRILSSIPDAPFDRMLEATAHARNGDRERAAAAAALIPEDYLSSPRALRDSYKKMLFESLKPYVISKRNAARALEARRKNAEALREYSAVLKIAEDREKTEIKNDIARLIKKDPSLARLSEEARRHVMRAEVATKEGKFDDAVVEYTEAIKLSPYFPNLYKALALNHAALKAYRQAIRSLQTYLDLSPDAADARTAKDQLYKWEFMMEKGRK